MTSIPRTYSMSSVDGFAIPTGTPKMKRKGIRIASGDSEVSSASCTSVSGTPLTGRKRRKTPPGKRGVEETELAKAKPALRSVKTPRIGEAEPAGESGLLLPPSPSTSALHGPSISDRGEGGQTSSPLGVDTEAPVEWKTHSEPTQTSGPEVTPVVVIHGDSSEMEEEEWSFDD